MKMFRVLVIVRVLFCLIVISVLFGAQMISGQTVEPKVTDVDGEVVTIGIGSMSGITTGMVIKIIRRDEPVIHPLTHEVLGTPMVPVCTVVIGEATANSATGRITRQYMRPVVGDRVQFRPRGEEKRFTSTSIEERRVSTPTMGGSQVREQERQRERPQTPRGIEFSSETERAQFLEALKATYDFAKLSQDIKTMKRLSQRIEEVERSLAEQRKQIDEVGKSLKGDIASVHDEITTLKDEITLLKTRFEDLTKTVQGTGISLKGKDPELTQPHPAEQQTNLEEGGEEESSAKDEHRTPPHKAPTTYSDPWYYSPLTWSIVLAVVVVGTGALIFVIIRRFRGRGQTETGVPSIKKRRRVELATQGDDDDSTEQHVKEGGKKE